MLFPRDDLKYSTEECQAERWTKMAERISKMTNADKRIKGILKADIKVCVGPNVLLFAILK